MVGALLLLNIMLYIFRERNTLWYSGNLCNIFLIAERTLVLWNSVLYISTCGTLFGVVLYFSVCGKRSHIVDSCVQSFRMWNALWYWGILCYIFLLLECTLVLWNLMLYFSMFGTLSGIAEFRVIFSVCGMCYVIVEFCVSFFYM